MVSKQFGWFVCEEAYDAYEDKCYTEFTGFRLQALHVVPMI
jgi:hypothetical protein